MSTLSYLRVQLRQAERRLGRYQAARKEIEARMAKDPNARHLAALNRFDAAPNYVNAQAAVRNLTAALAREEGRLYQDANAAL